MSIKIKKNNFIFEISKEGGAILELSINGTPLLRKATCGKDNFNIVKTSNFPLLPFGNRVVDNIFTYKGKKYTLKPNTAWDTHYVHGDAWLLPWTLVSHTDDEVIIEVLHEQKEGEPYSYRAQQVFSIGVDEVHMRLSIENLNQHEMPFGMGHHFFFPLTPMTTLQATHKEYWTEREHFLPDKLCMPPDKLNFNQAKTLPQQWINNGYETWNSQAEIIYPENNVGINIIADKSFGRFFLFRSSLDFEPDFEEDYFCFEPMTHTANAHRLEGDWGLIQLKSRESFAASITLRPYLLH